MLSISFISLLPSFEDYFLDFWGKRVRAEEVVPQTLLEILPDFIPLDDLGEMRPEAASRLELGVTILEVVTELSFPVLILRFNIFLGGGLKSI